MNKRLIKISQLIDFLGTDLLKIEGEENVPYIDNIPDPAHVVDTSLDWVNQ